jgi:GDSL-like Lipase/Acylhydrolase family
MRDLTAPSRLAGFSHHLLLLVATLLALAAAEGLLALFGLATPEPPIYPGERTVATGPTVDPLIGWKLPPNATVEESGVDYDVSYQANPQGFRSPQDFERATPRRRIVLLGDSYTFGTGVEQGQTFAARLEHALRRTRTYNFGIGGFGVDQMWRTLHHYALAVRPDVVVLAFIRNDLDRSLSAIRLGHDWLAKPTYRLDGEKLVPLTLENRPGALARWVSARSRLLELWRRVGYSVGWRFPVGYRWRLNRAIFAAVRDECRAAGVPLVVVHLPVNRRTPAPMLSEEFARLEIPFLDLTDHLPPDADALYFEHDPHFSPAGHRFAAEEIARFLVEQGLAEPARRRR